MLGQSIVILNKPGASGTIGVGYVTKSEPDGYTIGGVPSGAITMAPHVAAQSFQQADYRIVAMITQAAGVLCVHPDFPAKNATEFLAELKNNPDKYTYGSDGVGAFVQFSTARIFQPAGHPPADHPLYRRRPDRDRLPRAHHRHLWRRHRLDRAVCRRGKSKVPAADHRAALSDAARRRKP